MNGKKSKQRLVLIHNDSFLKRSNEVKEVVFIILCVCALNIISAETGIGSCIIYVDDYLMCKCASWCAQKTFGSENP